MRTGPHVAVMRGARRPRRPDSEPRPRLAPFDLGSPDPPRGRLVRAAPHDFDPLAVIGVERRPAAAIAQMPDCHPPAAAPWPDVEAPHEAAAVGRRQLLGDDEAMVPRRPTHDGRPPQGAPSAPARPCGPLTLPSAASGRRPGEVRLQPSTPSIGPNRTEVQPARPARFSEDFSAVLPKVPRCRSREPRPRPCPGGGTEGEALASDARVRADEVPPLRRFPPSLRSR